MFILWCIGKISAIPFKKITHEYLSSKLEMLEERLLLLVDFEEGRNG